MTRKPAVLMLNNYSMAAIERAWHEGRYPSHHLWGGDGLPEHGFQVVIPPFAALPRLTRFLKPRLPQAWGDLDQQIRALFRFDYDLVYSACQYTSGLLARLRCRGLFRKPLVALVHHDLVDTADNRAFVAGHTRLLCLSSRVRERLIGVFGVPEEDVRVLAWGPELRFFDGYRNDSGTEPIVASIGKSFRDHDTLVAAVRDTGLRALIIGTPPTQMPAPDGVEVMPVEMRGPHMPYPEVLRLCRGVRVIAIPLAETYGLAGLTGLVDALGMGKPVIMTRNAFVDIDIEREGIGLWVDTGDIAGWRRAIQELASDEARCSEMGRRARALAERRYNTRVFAEQLAGALSEALADPRPFAAHSRVSTAASLR